MENIQNTRCSRLKLPLNTCSASAQKLGVNRVHDCQPRRTGKHIVQLTTPLDVECLTLSNQPCFPLYEGPLVSETWERIRARIG